jgi:serine/threonine protein kinase
MYGTPNEKLWPGITKLPDFKQNFPQFKPKGLNSYCNLLCDNGLDLLSKMVVYDPCKRISAKNAMNHVRYLTLFYSISFFTIFLINLFNFFLSPILMILTRTS